MKKAHQLSELNVIRSLMILWIFVTHFYEHIYRGAYFANPNQDWPSIVERFTQLKPVSYSGIKFIGVNIFRYLGLFGDQGVQVFFVISGFVLTFGIIAKNTETIKISEFYQSRFIRIYPAWILCHLILIFTFIVFHEGINPFSIKTWISITGLRIFPQVFYFGSPAWWFVGCLIQLYIVFPFLYAISIGRKKPQYLLLIITAGVFIRLAGLYGLQIFAPRFINAWSRGLLFISRVPEFCAGIFLAFLYEKQSENFLKFITSVKGLLIAFLLWTIGSLSSFFFYGMAIAFLFSGVGAFLFLWGLLQKVHISTEGILHRFSTISFEFFLVHMLIISASVPSVLHSPSSAIIYFIMAFVISIIASFVCHLLIDLRIIRSFFLSMYSFISKNLLGLVLGIIFIYILLVGIELLIQKIDPQEINGWGERPALQPDMNFGYTLIPDKTTRLRWQSYNYTVRSNKLGFPGPLYSEQKKSNRFRILVTGDAFESAEGVDTDQSWVRILEERLNQGNVNAEVMNFSITGWGPQHYSRVAKEYIPKYKPDLFIVGLFINDLIDVGFSDAQFNRRIGFGNRSGFSILTTFKLSHLMKSAEFFLSRQLSKLNKHYAPKESHLGQSDLLKKENLPSLKEGASIVRKHLSEIKSVAEKQGSLMIVVLVPSSIQCADLSELEYLPKDDKYLNIQIYDKNQPQRLFIDICQELKIDYFDIREAFNQIGGVGVYQPRNMHWTVYGHEIVAKWLSSKILQQ